MEHTVSSWKEKLKQHKFMILILILVVVGLLLMIGLSNARYKSQVEGEIEYEPALFNTVLLGDLKYSAQETAGKLSASIDVTDDIKFGATVGDDALQSDERRLRPGSVVAIPITITNGTTLDGTKTNDDGTTETTAGNLAGTDIAYTLNVITTTNIPLEYDVYEYTNQTQKTYMQEFSKDDKKNYKEYQAERIAVGTTSENWGTRLQTEDLPIKENEFIGYSQTHAIYPQGFVKPEAGAEADPDTTKFFLERDEENPEDSIVINRYMLVIYWPDIAGADTELTTTELRSTEYMKEIDIVEVRLEVESWVKNVGNISDLEYNQATTSILRLTTAPGDNDALYVLPDTAEDKSYPHAGNTYGTITVPFYATRPVEDSTTESYLDIRVTNVTGREVTQWDAAAKKYDTQEDLAPLTDGRVAIAVPVQSTMGTVNNYEAGYIYKINYQGKTYTGTPGDKYITTSTWRKNTGSEPGTVAGEFRDVPTNAYRIVTFEDAEGKALVLRDFSADKAAEDTVRLIVTKPTAAVSYDNKDDLKILVYQGTAEAATPPVEGGGQQ